MLSIPVSGVGENCCSIQCVNGDYCYNVQGAIRDTHLLS